ncbi:MULTISPECIES: arsenate reductase family protein [Fusobacterium]|uniref:arsenate reductase family protein n=1 Tax=Fusobacterium TaxID=848 RepID=UPI0014776F71|nr:MULTISPECIES: arsenate reductase family protein [Fusobacterium]NME36393.1 arsenate reductase family protein [Fusobacterium sp. FSA-380-WT-3A]
MSILFFNYPKCSTCVKAKKWLEENEINFVSRHIVEERPTIDELKSFIKSSNLPFKKFFNTSGILYRELDLKNKIPTMNEEEAITLLASNGMLVKRPLIVCDKGILIGFKVEEWKKFFNK